MFYVLAPRRPVLAGVPPSVNTVLALVVLVLGVPPRVKPVLEVVVAVAGVPPRLNPVLAVVAAVPPRENPVPVRPNPVLEVVAWVPPNESPANTFKDRSERCSVTSQPVHNTYFVIRATLGAQFIVVNATKVICFER